MTRIRIPFAACLATVCLLTLLGPATAQETDRAILQNFDGPTAPLHHAGDEYPRSLYGE